MKRVVEGRFGVVYHERTIGKLLKMLGFSHISARPRHPSQKAESIAAFEEKVLADAEGASRACPGAQAHRNWFQDEARIGQKNGQVRQWAKRGTRPRQPADQRYENASADPRR